ncbi:MAG: arginine--tRNA ligase [Candidatus Omnitrophota bacterium]
MKEKISASLLRLIVESLSDVPEATGALVGLKEELYLELPKDSRFGDLATNIALRLAKPLKRSPPELAQDLAEKIKIRLQKSNLGLYVKEVKAAGGFVNFSLREEYFYKHLLGVVRNGKGALRMDFGCGRKVLLEFVSANPTGPLSVAHARQAAVGDALARVLFFLGFKVRKEYYLNDEGNQIDILGRSVELRLRELEGKEVDFPDDHYQGDYIYEIARTIKDKGRRVGDFKLYAVGHILKVIREELRDFGVHFDCWYSQKSLRKSGRIKKTLHLLERRGLLYRQEGALWFKSTQFGDDKDRVVVKSDGSYTYLAPDIAYHREKYRRGFMWLINLWGPDHHGYINRLKAAVQALGEKADSLSVIIVQLATIFRAGQQVLMSTRRGQYITMREVLDEVGRDAARFFFVMRRTDSHLDFDLEIAKKKNSDNPVYYVQYAHARICSILANSPAGRSAKEADFSLLKEAEELALIRKLWELSYVLEVCLKTADPYMLTVYLQELAETFHKFYDRHRVLGQGKELTSARLALISATRTVIATGLDLLGISAPEKM